MQVDDAPSHNEPVTPATLADLENVDMLLRKLDAARYALPAVVRSKVPGGAHDDRIREYRHSVARAEDSLNNLQAHLNGSQDRIARFLARFLQEHGAAPLPDRIRKNPYTHRHISSSSQAAPLYTSIPYPESATSPPRDKAELNDRLNAVIVTYKGVELSHPPSGQRQLVLGIVLAGKAQFYVFIVHDPDGKLAFQRISATHVDEKKRAYEASDYAIWRDISIQASQAVRRASRAHSLNVECIISLLSSYADTHDKACSAFTCSRVLHPVTLLPPTARAHRAVPSRPSEKPKESISSGVWQPFHPACLPA